MNNNPYINPYVNTYNQQPINYNQQMNTLQTNNYDEYLKYLEKEKERVEKSKEQYMSKIQQQQPTSINQTFQLAPNNNAGIKYVNSIDDVRKETIFNESAYFSKDLSVVWIKNPNGGIKAYELNEIVEKDEKDLQIEFLISQQQEKDNRIDSLQTQLNDLKGMIKNEQFDSNVNEKQTSTNTTTDDESIGKPIKKSKSTSIQRVSTSKKGE
jgi:hypothetical protein